MLGAPRLYERLKRCPESACRLSAIGRLRKQRCAHETLEHTSSGPLPRLLPFPALVTPPAIMKHPIPSHSFSGQGTKVILRVCTEVSGKMLDLPVQRLGCADIAHAHIVLSMQQESGPNCSYDRYFNSRARNTSKAVCAYLCNHQASISVFPDQFLAQAELGANAVRNDLEGLHFQLAQVFPCKRMD